MALVLADEDRLRLLLIVDGQLELNRPVPFDVDIETVRFCAGLEAKRKLGSLFIHAPGIRLPFLFGVFNANRDAGLDTGVLDGNRAVKRALPLGSAADVPAAVVVPDVIPGGLVNDAPFGS